MNHRMLGLVFRLLMLAGPWGASAQPQPAGGEFRVNTYTTGIQYDPLRSLRGALPARCRESQKVPAR
jgi:hypothetical protein